VFIPRPFARPTNRRRFLGGSAVGLAALSLGMSGLPGSAPRTASAQGAPWAGGDVPLASRSSRQMSVAARALLDSLGTDQLGTLWYPDLGDAARTKWSNFPAGASPRAGLSIGSLTDSQRALMHDLLRASTSTQGYHKLTGAIRADDVLYDLEGESLFGASHYYASIFGTPEDVNWGWMLTGHHMAAAFTISGDRTGFTPMFTGAQPLQVPSGIYAGWQVLPQDAARGGELLASLSSDQQAMAVIGTSVPGDVVAGPGRQASLSSFQGLTAGQMDAGQQRLLWLLVQEFVGNADFDAAEAHLALVQQNWAETYFSWLGPPPDPTSRYYFRVHGPRILIEYDVQEPLTNNGGHVHAITRDPANDYGMDWLGLHYQEGNPIPGGPGGAGGPPGPGGGPRGGPPPGP
jgi:Protein of unknown function (DUF3500)